MYAYFNKMGYILFTLFQALPFTLNFVSQKSYRYIDYPSASTAAGQCIVQTHSPSFNQFPVHGDLVCYNLL